MNTAPTLGVKKGADAYDCVCLIDNPKIRKKGGQRMSKKKPPYFVVEESHGELRVKGALLAKYVREHLPFKLVRSSGRSDLQVFVYKNGVYKLCAPETFKGIIKQFIADFDESLITMIVVNEAFNQLMTDLNFCSIEDLNADESIINFENGILNVTADETVLLPHSPEILSTIQIPCNWADAAVPTPVFDDYMNTLTSGDRWVADLLLEFIGVAISNVKGYRMKKSLFMVGPGDTGKSQLKSLCEKLVGHENFSSCDFNDLEERFGTSDLYGKRLAGSADASHMSVKELKTFKKLTGGDSIHAEFKGQKAFDFTFNGLLWLCMNSLPKFGGDNGPWVYERIMVVTCDNVIPKEKQDKCLLDKMFAEREGIIQKAVAALQKVIRNEYRYDEPMCVLNVRKQYKLENSSVAAFFADCMCHRPQNKITDCCTTGRVYKVYQSWCKNNNHGYSETERDFRTEVSMLMGGEFKDVTVKRNGYSYYRDYTLTLDAKQDHVAAYGYDTVV
jgi:P4 family phage/plasmid primase-like protien